MRYNSSSPILATSNAVDSPRSGRIHQVSKIVAATTGKFGARNISRNERPIGAQFKSTSLDRGRFSPRYGVARQDVLPMMSSSFGLDVVY